VNTAIWLADLPGEKLVILDYLGWYCGWPCCLSTEGLVVCLQMALLFVYRWPCCLSTYGLVVCLQMALLFVYRCTKYYWLGKKTNKQTNKKTIIPLMWWTELVKWMFFFSLAQSAYICILIGFKFVDCMMH
jgi:hypothetical protein